MPAPDELREALSPLASLAGVEGAAVVARDGRCMAAKLPAGVDHFTFGAMIATLLGAAASAAYEFHRKPGAQMSMDLGSIHLVAADAGDQALVVAMVAHEDGAADEALRATASVVRAILGA